MKRKRIRDSQGQPLFQRDVRQGRPPLPDGGKKQRLYDAHFKRQKGKCALCREPLSAVRRFNHLDHDHKTGRYRGIVHHTCNHALGGVDAAIALVGLDRLLLYLGFDSAFDSKTPDDSSARLQEHM